MLGHFKTLAAAIITMLIGASFAESAEISAEPSEDQVESPAQPSDDGDTPNIMGDIL